MYLQCIYVKCILHVTNRRNRRTKYQVLSCMLDTHLQGTQSLCVYLTYTKALGNLCSYSYSYHWLPATLYSNHLLPKYRTSLYCYLQQCMSEKLSLNNFAGNLDPHVYSRCSAKSSENEVSQRLNWVEMVSSLIHGLLDEVGGWPQHGVSDHPPNHRVLFCHFFKASK